MVTTLLMFIIFNQRLQKSLDSLRYNKNIIQNYVPRTLHHVVSLNLDFIGCLENVTRLGGERRKKRLGTHYDTLLACPEMF